MRNYNNKNILIPRLLIKQSNMRNYNNNNILIPNIVIKTNTFIIKE